MRTPTYILKPLLRSRMLWGMLFSMALYTNANAQIVIGGDVYGGGRQGSVGTLNQFKPDNVSYVEKDSVKLKELAERDTTTKVTINAGTMRTVFGGGENGRTYGSTNVIIRGGSDSGQSTTYTQIGGELNSIDWTGTTRGGVFGAGDGDTAYVFGHSSVTISGGFIPQNVYGGGNQADLMGSASVTLQGGDIQGTLYGGSRLANIYGYSYVNIDGANMKNDLLIGAVYGGNDIAGNIINLQESDPRWEWTKGLQPPTGIEAAYQSWNTFVRSTAEAQGKHIYVGQIFGGGNGDYTYSENQSDNTKLDVDTLVDQTWNGSSWVRTKHTYTVNTQPEVEKAYLDLNGGAFGYAFGGGNRATVTIETVISINNNSSTFRALSKELLGKMSINLDIDTTAYIAVGNDSVRPVYQFDRVFGGNNLAEMKIQPTWKLQNANINNLYSGGNEGLMSYPDGLLLALTSPGITVKNVYGGSRKANVTPMLNGVVVQPNEKTYDVHIQGQLSTTYTFPAEHSARILITDGQITNVYGGNDISGDVAGGNAIIIAGSIKGDVYGGGNGSYFYTDKKSFVDANATNKLRYGDFYYNPDTVLTKAGVSVADNSLKSITALNLFRPNAERVYISVKGTSTKKTVIGGSLYCGGNSATITAAPGTNAEDKIKLNLGSYVIADKVFLGNNGENMIDSLMLTEYADNDKSSLNLTNSDIFARYMSGVSMNMKPSITFDRNLKEYTTFIGSLYCGGNVGSMTYAGRNEQNFNEPIIVYNKVVGGSNNAFVPARQGLNAVFDGGILGAEGETDFDSARIVLNFSKMLIEPLRLAQNDSLEWNTKKWKTYTDKPAELIDEPNGTSSRDLRLDGGNIYGGCYNSGHVNGNVVINMRENLLDIDKIFADAGKEGNSGVYYDDQGEDVLISSMYVYGGGSGKETEIWGSTTINLEKGFMFQIVGGGEKGAIGKRETDNNGNFLKDQNGDYIYRYNPKYSTYVNINGETEGAWSQEDDEHYDQTLAEAVYVYGGGFEGTVAGNTNVYLGNGRVYDAFGGACNADILGHSELYLGKALKFNAKSLITDTISDAFPWVTDNVYGGNDFGGRIMGYDSISLADKVRPEILPSIYKYQAGADDSYVLHAQAYVEYNHGRVDTIYGGSYGSYDYTDQLYYKYTYVEGGNLTDENNLGTFRTGYNRPYLENAFVNIRPAEETFTIHRSDIIRMVFGAGMGYSGYTNPGEYEKDLMQQRSYVLVDIPDDLQNFSNLEVFGSGAYSGLGMTKYVQPGSTGSDSVSAVVDLMQGKIAGAYGGGYNEGITRRTVVNVPAGSTIHSENIFGGGYGNSQDVFCDVYESEVNFNSKDATVGHTVQESGGWNSIYGGVFGGNNNSRRTLYAKVNINSELWSDKSLNQLAKVYGAGYGKNTWSNYTEVNLNNGAMLSEAYGGGLGGKVLNKVSENKMATDNNIPLYFGAYSNDGNLDNDLVTTTPLNDTCNTNVYINRGAVVGYYFVRSDTIDNASYVKINDGYCYGGGYGADAVVSGTTYIGLHGGRVWKDLYAGGTSGGVKNESGTDDFIAQANAYIEGGSVRNVYGGGWKGHIGYSKLEPHEYPISEVPDKVRSLSDDILGRTNVVVGILEDDSTKYGDYGFYRGVPTIERNVYGGGEGGAVFGTASLTINNGYIGYRYFDFLQDDTATTFDDRYQEKINDETWFITGVRDHSLDSLNRLVDSGNAFGGGYVDSSWVDISEVKMYGGYVRNSVYGGGEVAIIGRGEAHEVVVDNKRVRQLKAIYKSGSTDVNLYSGHVLQNVFGGGKGFNNTGDQGNRYTNGYVFGTTSVNIFGGEVGTIKTVADGAGNVFGGGNIGYVYNSLQSKKDSDGYYYLYDSIPGQPGGWHNREKILSEDCRVVVTPYAKVIDAAGITLSDTLGGSKTFSKGEYVPTVYLLKLHKDAAEWSKLDQSGIIIRNALFAGGNVSTGNTLYANTKTVFGNATATLNDLYHTDLITLGTEHVGGLYGDGNLTRVDGYRELNITNYGTDYYSLNQQVSIEDYEKMNDRERAYFEIKYQLIKDYNEGGVTQSNTPEKTPEEIKTDYAGTPLVTADGSPSPEYWQKYGFASVYAGRLINTIQRADFVGVFGSRMVLQGARDRVPETVDFTDYSLNRVGEISLNRRTSPEDRTIFNGNYFGIYNIANYLGAITSDVDFNDVRVTSSDHQSKEDYAADGTTTFYEWKDKYQTERKRNDGESENKVALASGVYLELVKESNGKSEKEWGEVTGVLELQLINVMPGLGGGYVYAKNIHGERYNTNKKQVTLSSYNKNAVSNKQYGYDSKGGEADSAFQTSGNFVNPIKEIIDDCYPGSGYYSGANAAPAHYWYIKGRMYIYDQYISAYTGAADSYDKTVNIPLTITAGSNGRLQLIDVKTNKYAYWKTYISPGNQSNTPLGSDDKYIINDRSFYLNDTISYWDWSLLSPDEQSKFVDSTYVVVADCMIGNDTIRKGTVILPSRYTELKAQTSNRVTYLKTGTDTLFTDMFRLSNNLSHNNGYALTFSITNPRALDAYYTPKTGAAESGKVIAADFKKGLDDGTYDRNDYYSAPTYTPITTGVYGQRFFKFSDIITQRTYDSFKTIEAAKQTLGDSYDSSNDAEFDTAFVLTQKVQLDNGQGITYLNEGLVISMADYRNYNLNSSQADTALFCIDTWKLHREDFDDEYVNYGASLTRAQIYELGTTYAYDRHYIDSIIDTHFSQAYFCTKEGKYGGAYFEEDKNYTTLTAWSSMNPEDRDNFKFNYDAFDLLTDSLYSKQLRLYDGDNSKLIYSASLPIDYEARYHGSAPLVYTDPQLNVVTVQPEDTLTSVEYEAIPNEQSFYAPFMADKGGPNLEKDTLYYIVRRTFTTGDVTYSAGNSLTPAVFRSLTRSDQLKVDSIRGSELPRAGKYYYCRKGYVIGERGTVQGKNGAVIDRWGNHVVGDSVKIGCVITESNYQDSLPNLQKDFTVHGHTPVETSTLYVSGQSNILDLSKGRIFTVIYQYSYEESDGSGLNIELITEQHIVNIYVQFKSGTPTIPQIPELETILPGSTIGLTTPDVKPGAYEVIGGGWEIFANTDDAENHVNGMEFDNTRTKLYWYQDGYYLAYYAKTYLGKTYSNAVPFKIGNYHNLDKVMADTAHHMYVDHPNVKRNSKIYIDDRQCTSDKTKNELDLLKDFYDLSITTIDANGDGKPDTISTGDLKGHVVMSERVKGANHIDFILRSDMSPKKYTTWTPIGTDANNCFKGTIHGDGHTISGLTSSLFGYMCDGEVFNLGVTGSFGGTSSGISDHGGSAINTWIYTTGTITNNTNAIMGDGVASNSYYPEEITGYTAPAGVTALPLSSFHNGEVAYNLNGFYLNKRYNDKHGVSGQTYEYKYYNITDNAANRISAPVTAYNKQEDAPYEYLTSQGTRHLGYVENRYIDGDFIYAGGFIRSSANERLYTARNENDKADNGLYFPIWPDDYIYFGQMLTYGYSSVTGQEYQEFPSGANKADRAPTASTLEATTWLVRENAGLSNRVYRAPAYYGNSEQSKVHFNANAYIPAKASASAGSMDVYPGLTAVDFAGQNDSWTNNDIFSKYLDYNGLTGIRTDGQTRNLLVYAPYSDLATMNVLTRYFTEPDYTRYYYSDKIIANTNAHGKESVRRVDNVTNIHGHVIEYNPNSQNTNKNEAVSSQFLVDREEFNAPISYDLGDMFMWYQRTPDAFVEQPDSGWQSISLPFTATTVTTSQKGIITHFYEGSNKGHEYWLRTPNDVAEDGKTLNFQSIRNKAGNSYLDETADITYTNTFLWDYYYNRNSGHVDVNSDEYQTYYKDNVEYDKYPFAVAATPYLIGFPGSRYYEFDMSGQFKPNPDHTNVTIAKLDPQTITFISASHQTIGVSDDDYDNVITVDDYTYRPTYQSRSVGADTTLLLNARGSRFVKAERDTVTVPFRAYLTKHQVAGHIQERATGTRASALYIGYSGDQMPMEDIVIDHGLNIYGQHLNIYIESTLEQPATITITSVSGQLLKQFTIQPGTRVAVPVNSRGVYIVNHRKIAVTK